MHRAHVQSLAPSHQDSAGNIYVAGTSGRNFPSTPGSPFGGSAAASVFLAKINPATGLLYSYPIPGLSGKVAVALDAQGSVYFAGDYSGFATTPGALQAPPKPPIFRSLPEHSKPPSRTASPVSSRGPLRPGVSASFESGAKGAIAPVGIGGVNNPPPVPRIHTAQPRLHESLTDGVDRYWAVAG